MDEKGEKDETVEVKVSGETLTCCPETPKIQSNTATSKTTSTSTQISARSSSDPEGRKKLDADGESDRGDIDGGEAGEEPLAKRVVVNRCSGCGKRVGLTGFRCRCGELFCWSHRYSDRHECSYDYKAAGRAAIARENPVVRPSKLLKV